MVIGVTQNRVGGSVARPQAAELANHQDEIHVGGHQPTAGALWANAAWARHTDLIDTTRLYITPSQRDLKEAVAPIGD